MPFNSPEGNLEDIFVNDYAMIDQYANVDAVWLWGENSYGQLGDNTITGRSSPIQTIAGGTNWKILGAGDAHTAIVKTDGTLWLWGNNSSGQLGNNATLNISSPVQTVSAGTNWNNVAGGSAHTVAIKTDGTLWGWGLNLYGQLGNSTTTSRSSPVQTISSGNDWKQVACGALHTVSIKTDGTLWGWGLNNIGQLGNNATINTSSPVQTMAGGNDWKQVSSALYTTAAIKTNGSLWLWGNNSAGQLGDGTTVLKSSPVQTISGGTNWKQVVCGAYHCAAIKTDGTLWLWGGNSYGQLGDNTTANKSSPIQTVAGGTNWKQVACGDYFTSAVKTDGTIWTWGYNNRGQLGNNTTTSTSSPVQTTAGGTIWKRVICGGRHMIALRDQVT